MKYGRNDDQYRDVEVRIKDWGEIYNHRGVQWNNFYDSRLQSNICVFGLDCKLFKARIRKGGLFQIRGLIWSPWTKISVK